MTRLPNQCRIKTTAAITVIQLYRSGSLNERTSLVRVLHVIGGMNRAGAETFLMNLYRAIDRKSIQFDFLVHTEDECDYDQEVRDLGGRIYRLPRFNGGNFLSYKNACQRFFEEHPEHAIVHGHIGSSAVVYLHEAKKMHRLTVAHSHSVTPWFSAHNFIYNCASKPVRFVADFFMACSQEAAESRFGAISKQHEKCLIISNGIDTHCYRRDRSIALRSKEKLGLTDYPVFAHVGRFAPEKNHPFLVEVFSGIQKKLPDSRLLLVGRGKCEENIRELVKKRGLANHVLFLGPRDDIPDILNASDVFLFPSINEGLGIALVEAQTSGLQALASTSIPDEAIITDRATRLPLSDPDIWVHHAVKAYEKSLITSGDCIPQARKAGYDIIETAQRLEKFYLSHNR